MPFRSKELKAKAWASMRAAAPSAILVTLVYYLLTQVLSNVVQLLTTPITVESLIYERGAWITIALFLSILLALYSSVMNFGYRVWTLHIARGEEAGYHTLLDGFGMVGRVILLELLIVLRMIGWLFVIMLMFSLVMAPLIMVLEYASIFPILVLSILIYLVIFALFCRYELSYYLLWDHPEDGVGAAIRRSVQLVQPRLWAFFKLYLSFWPWYLGQAVLSLVGSGILLAAHFDPVRDLLAYGDVAAAITAAQMTLSTTPGVLMGLLTAILPLGIFFIPYLNLSIANFYRAASGDLNPYREQENWPDWTM